MNPLDSLFLQKLLEILNRHNVTITNMDLDNRILDLDGTDENLMRVASDIEKELGEYCE